MNWGFDKPVRAELTKDVNGLYPGERERGFPDFLRRKPKAEPVMCTLCSASDDSMFYHGCMVKDGHAPEWDCNGGKLTPKTSLSGSPPATTQSALPPSAASFGSLDA